MKNTHDSIYKIITANGSGTGFKVAEKDFVITNYHVIKGSKEVAVEDQHKNRYLAQVVMVNPKVDLAFLNVNGLKSVPGTIHLEENFQAHNMEKVFINGFPFGMPFTVTEGIISSVNQPMDGRNYIQTDAAVNPGNSGGPMLNEEGILVGVTTSKFSNADNVGFGIKHTDIIKEINDYQFTDENYHVKCNSCDSFINEEAEFCPNCGNTIDASVFEEFEQSHFTVFTEEALTQLGINPVLCRAGRDYWEFHQGSALVRIFVVRNNYLFASSPLNNLPKGNLEELLVYLTSNNVSPYQLGIYNNKIYISYRAYLSDIYTDRKDEIKENLINLALKADELDDFFKDNYNCEMAVESKSIEDNFVNTVQQAGADKEENQEIKTVENHQKDNIVDRLKKLKNLFELELISEADYTSRKNEILAEV